MSVYSTSLFAGNAPASGGVLYTAPANAVVVVRDITLYNSTGGALTSSISRYASGSFAGVIFTVPSLAASAYEQWTGRQVLDAGDELVSGNSAAGVYTLISGYVLV